MRFHIITVIALAMLCSVQSAGRKKIISAKKFIDTKAIQNTTIDALKASEKLSYPKKVISLKKRPTKSSSAILATNATKDSKDVTDIFKNLPADDFAFIKELDKQFKLHGNKLKIKVERENATSSSKNSKRTIDGELGYGYEHNGYTYEKPKFMFYPYSQKDIPASAPAYYPQYETTSVTIEPSYSYELKPQTYLVHHHHAAAQPQIDLPHSQDAEQQVVHSGGESVHQQEGYQEPIIVLRIPGPTKYASHLQSLLQQYLEIRAAQYLRILQENEARKQQQQQQVSHQHYNQEQQQHYEQELPPPPAHTSQHVETPSQDYADFSHQEAPAAQPLPYPAIDDVYQAYKERQQYQQPSVIQHQHQQQQNVEENSADQHGYVQLTGTGGSQQYYYPEEQQQKQQEIPEQPHSNAAYPQFFVIAMAPAVYSSHSQHLEHHHHQQQQQQQYDVPQQQQPIYVQEDEAQYTNQAYEHEQSSGHLATSENNPRPTHTKIIFTQKDDGNGYDHSNEYPLPSIRPHDRHQPSTTAHYQHQYKPQQHSPIDFDYQQTVEESASHQQVVSITQKPFNYHAHSSKVRSRPGRKRATAGTATTTANAPSYKAGASSRNVGDDEKHLQKIRKFVHENLGAQASTVVELKTTTNMKN